MRQYLLPNEGQFYKANLHCHSTVSDGRGTPEQMKECYKSHGYQILAITDHEIVADHSDLTDPDFLMLTGFEYAFLEPLDDWRDAETLEINFFARDPHNTTQFCFTPARCLHNSKEDIEKANIVGDLYPREYSFESVQHVIDEGVKHGYIASINHPSYSYIKPEFFGKFKNIFAMEICNQGCLYPCNEYNTQMYDEVLRMGNKISCIGADDNHWFDIYDDKEDIRPWAHTMIKAKSLTYDDVFAALENGDFYASQGPRIEELYIEDGKVYIKTSKAKVIAMQTGGRRYKTVHAPAGEDVTEAVFDVPDDNYIRFDVVDGYGRHANTRGYFLK